MINTFMLWWCDLYNVTRNRFGLIKLQMHVATMYNLATIINKQLIIPLRAKHQAHATPAMHV